jgi:hypothetical protein
MKKILKRVALGLAILVLLVVIAISIALWFVFTPEKLTPIVRKQAANYITCQYEIGEVELTFFSTFPNFGLKVNRFTLVNPLYNAPSDTLVAAEQLVGIFDVMAFWKRNELVITDLQLHNGVANAFIDSLGRTNFDIVTPDPVAEPVDTTESVPFKFIDIKNVDFKNVSFTYVDQQLKLNAKIDNLTAQFSGYLKSDIFDALIKVSESVVSVNFDGEQYLNAVAIAMNMPLQVNLASQLIKLANAEASFNSIDFEVNGSVENDTINKKMITDISFSTNSFSIPDMLALVPPSFQSYFEGLEAEGIMSSTGTVKGDYTDTSMPLMNIKFDLKNGNVKYSAIPLPLSKANGSFEFNSDLNNDAITYFRINSFSAKTPKSSFTTRGVIRNLFSDMYIDLNTDANLVLAEFKSFIPSDMNIKVQGKVVGNVKSAFKMSHVDNMLIDKMRISGSVVMSNFDATYDSMRLVTNYSIVDFALPNPRPTSQNSKYLYMKVNSKELTASMLDGTFAKMKDARFTVETSDVMNAVGIPNVYCVYDLDSLTARMDTIKVAAFRPNGQLSLVSKKGSSLLSEVILKYNGISFESQMGSESVRMNNIRMDANIVNPETQPEVKLAYSGEGISIKMGLNSVNVNKLKMNSNVVNDTTQTDMFLQWKASGFLDMENGVIGMAEMKYPIEIPSIKLDFNPEVFNIKDSKLKIDKSDFSLTGTLSNILSYFRNDSLLRGDFKFASNTTDLLQLMEISNGLGAGDTASVDTAANGPYMVPKGVDLRLMANVSKATFGYDTLSNVKGEVRVKDGILVLDNLVFSSPGGNMQLTAMYRTPRKNHLYLGLDYHLMNIEIEELLDMIPELDSIMPMLRSFKGKGEFHLAMETYTDSLYNLKKSTLRGACSVKGQDLVLMDGQTFTEIAKTLRFNKKTENKVDSLSAEFTVFKNEIDIYPFLIVMDKYKAVVSGRHNMDMSFNYHISLVDSPIPIKLGVDVSGTIDDLKYRLAKCKYAEMYRPAARGEVKNKQLELRRLIREALIQKVIKE